MVLVTTHDGKRSNVMTISWTMVVDFTPRFAITTGEWNYSYRALRKTRECVIAIPSVDMLDTVVGIGTCSGADTDKFEKFGLTPLPGKVVKAPLIKECLANIECRVVETIRRYDIMVLDAVAAHRASSPRESRTLHAVGDGTFVVDGGRLNRRRQIGGEDSGGGVDAAAVRRWQARCASAASRRWSVPPTDTPWIRPWRLALGCPASRRSVRGPPASACPDGGPQREHLQLPATALNKSAEGPRQQLQHLDIRRGHRTDGPPEHLQPPDTAQSRSTDGPRRQLRHSEIFGAERRVGPLEDRRPVRSSAIRVLEFSADRLVRGSRGLEAFWQAVTRHEAECEHPRTDLLRASQRRAAAPRVPRFHPCPRGQAAARG